MPLSSLSSLVNLDQPSLRCPYATYEALRGEGVQWSGLIDAWIVSRYDDVVDVLSNPDVFSSKGTLGRPPRDPDLEGPNDSPLLLLSDRPEHTTFRRIVSRAFTPSRVEAWEPEIRELADALIDEMAGSTELDFIDAFSGALPIAVITSVLGVPAEDAPMFRQYSEALTRSLGGHEDEDPDLPDRVRREFSARIRLLLDAVTDFESAHILPVIAEARSQGILTTEQSTRFVMELIVAGNVTTSHHLSSSVLLLAQDPALADRLRADPSLVPTFIEESLRMESPIQGFYRLVTADAEIGGQTVPAGSRVFVLYGSGNRDERTFPIPADLQLDRTNAQRHLAFGRGIHTCLGAPLARVEGRIAVEALLDRVASIELGASVEELPFLASFVNHGPVRLPVRLVWR